MKGLTGTVKLPTTVIPKTEFPMTGPLAPTIKTPSLIDILIKITNEDNIPLLTYDQAKTLTDIKFQNGEPILSLTHRPFIYEFMNMVKTVGYEKSHNFLSTDWEKIFGSNTSDIRTKILFRNPLLDHAREKLEIDMEIFRNKIDVEKGAVDCKKCGSEETISMEKQQRSADEPMTIKVRCLQCGFTWTAQ